jgi:multiple sugar transport system permease protein
MNVLQNEIRPKKRISNLQKKETLAALGFISPWIIGFFVFTFGPMIASLYLSLTEYDILRPPLYVGLDNYAQLLKDPKIAKSLYNSFFYTILHVPLATAVALALAMLLNSVPKRAAGFFRTAFYLPSITPSVAIGTLWLWLLNPRIGLINRGLEFIGINGPNWIADPNWVKPGIVLMSLWSVGGTIIIYLAALREVPKELYEASRIDGATNWKQFTKITLPMISGSISFTLIVNTISSLQIFSEVYTMYFGQMNASTGTDSALFFVIYLFRQAFEFLNMGYASAMAWVLFVIVMILTIIQMAFSKRWVYYEGE